jgi:hypothetical protein
VDRGQELDGILTACPRCSLAAPIGDVANRVQAVVTLPGVSDDRRDPVPRGRSRRLATTWQRRWPGRHPPPSQPLRTADLHGDPGQDLLAFGSPAPQLRFLPADEGLVHLDGPGQLLTLRANQDRAQPVNHPVSGVLVRSNKVPAVTDVRPPHPAHMNRPSPSRQLPPWPQSGQEKPTGQRSHFR